MEFTAKFTIQVMVYLSDGSTIHGGIFLEEDERITDMMNDDRNFIPLIDVEGHTNIVAKSNVVRMHVMNQDLVRVE